MENVKKHFILRDIWYNRERESVLVYFDKMMYYVYILRNNRDRLYIGSSAKPEERLKSHNAGRVRSIKQNRPWQRILLEEYPDRERAENRERYLKSDWGRKWLKRHILNGEVAEPGLMRRS